MPGGCLRLPYSLDKLVYFCFVFPLSVSMFLSLCVCEAKPPWSLLVVAADKKCRFACKTGLDKR